MFAIPAADKFESFAKIESLQFDAYFKKKGYPNWIVINHSFIDHFRHIFPMPIRCSRGQMISIVLRSCPLEILRQTFVEHFIKILGILASWKFLS